MTKQEFIYKHGHNKYGFSLQVFRADLASLMQLPDVTDIIDLSHQVWECDNLKDVQKKITDWLTQHREQPEAVKVVKPKRNFMRIGDKVRLTNGDIVTVRSLDFDCISIVGGKEFVPKTDIVEIIEPKQSEPEQPDLKPCSHILNEPEAAKGNFVCGLCGEIMVPSGWGIYPTKLTDKWFAKELERRWPTDKQLLDFIMSCNSILLHYKMVDFVKQQLLTNQEDGKQ
jgi:hypothetical protein